MVITIILFAPVEIKPPMMVVDAEPMLLVVTETVDDGKSTQRQTRQRRSPTLRRRQSWEFVTQTPFLLIMILLI